MKIDLSARQRTLILFACFAVTLVGFMIKLPSSFRHMDKELHATFYFLAAAFLNVLVGRGKVRRHVIIFISLFLCGIAIEYAQAYSNKFFRMRIHGRFDPEDVQANLIGLIAFTILWLLYKLVTIIYNKVRVREK